MRAGELNTRVDLLEPKYPEQRVGEAPAPTYVRRLSAWAAFESLETRDAARFRQPGAKSTARLTIRSTRSTAAVADDWRVSMGGQQWAIESIAPQPDRTFTTLAIYRMGI